MHVLAGHQNGSGAKPVINNNSTLVLLVVTDFQSTNCTFSQMIFDKLYCGFILDNTNFKKYSEQR